MKSQCRREAASTFFRHEMKVVVKYKSEEKRADACRVFFGLEFCNVFYKGH